MWYSTRICSKTLKDTQVRVYFREGIEKTDIVSGEKNVYHIMDSM